MSKRKRSELEVLAKTLIEEFGVPFEEEYRFDPERKWRLDFAFPQWKIGIEVEGGTWAGGRHTRGSGYEKDCEKYNAAAMQGWRVYRFTGGMVESGEFSEKMKEIIENKKERKGLRGFWCEQILSQSIKDYNKSKLT